MKNGQIIKKSLIDRLFEKVLEKDKKSSELQESQKNPDESLDGVANQTNGELYAYINAIILVGQANPAYIPKIKRLFSQYPNLLSEYDYQKKRLEKE